MNKTVFKIFIGFSFSAAIIATILLCINAFGLAIIASDTKTRVRGRSPQGVLDEVSRSLVKTSAGFSLSDNSIIPDNCWCILLNDDGNIIWSENQPEDIPVHYSIRDVAKLTRWYLNDYPVYVSAEDYGLLIFGIPKNAVGKYDMAYSMAWFDTLPKRIAVILVLNVALALILALAFGANIYRNLKRLTMGINDLKNEKTVRLPEKGIFKELAHNINETSNAIERKNKLLAVRDNARVNWVAGISHDIRTPLAIIMGISETLETSGELSEQNAKKAGVITTQSMKIKKLIEDLNLISSLEYDMQPSKKTPVRICPIIRRIAADIYNSGIGERYKISVETEQENAAVLGDSSLLERAFFNIINNSIVHNESGCSITIKEYMDNHQIFIEIKDNGVGMGAQSIKNTNEISRAGHGLGLPMSKKIIDVHGGSLTIKNNGGCCVIIKLPVYQK